jgi:hypothetical protein
LFFSSHPPSYFVFKAIIEKAEWNGKPVALKKLRELPDDSYRYDKLLHEVITLKKLSNNYIVPLLGIYLEGFGVDESVGSRERYCIVLLCFAVAVVSLVYLVVIGNTQYHQLDIIIIKTIINSFVTPSIRRNREISRALSSDSNSYESGYDEGTVTVSEFSMASGTAVHSDDRQMELSLVLPLYEKGSYLRLICLILCLLLAFFILPRQSCYVDQERIAAQ